MSKYDQERKDMGIKSNSTSTVSGKKTSKYDNERMDLNLIPDTRPQNQAPTQQLQSPAHTNVPKSAAPVSDYDSTYHKPQELQSPAHTNVPKDAKPAPKWNSLTDNPIVNTIKAIDKNVEAFQDRGANALTFGLNDKLMQRLGEQDKIESQKKSISGKVGGLTGDLVGIGKIYKAASGLTKGLKAGKTVKAIATGGLAGAGYQTAKEAVDLAVPDKGDTETLGHRAKDIAKEAALFAGGDVALRYAGKGIKAVSDKTGLTSKLSQSFDNLFKKSKPIESAPVQTSPTLGLPEPKSARMQRELQNRSTLPANTDVIRGEGNVETLGLPASKQYDEIQRIKAQQTLNLPEANPKTVAEFNRRNGNIQPANTDTIYGQGDVAEPLGLPQGEYIRPTRMKVNNPTETLDYVMTKIKPQVMSIIEAPVRRDLLVNYIQKNTGYAMDDIINRPMKELQELGQVVQKDLHGNIQKIAFDVAKRQGHDLPALLEGQAPNLRAQIAKDTQSQVYGVPAEKVNIAKPQFNKEVTGQAAAPKQGLSFKREPRVAEDKPFVETTLQQQQRIDKQIKDAADRKIISELNKPIVGRASLPETKIKNVFNIKPSETVVPKTKVKGLPVINNQTTPIPETVSKNVTVEPSMPNVSGLKERGFVTTIKDSEKTAQGVKEIVKSWYEPITNQKSVDLANKRVKDLETAASYVLGKSKFTAEKVTTAHRLIDEFSKSGNHQRAVDIAEKIAEEGTRAGQGIQAFSIYNRLTPEGVLVHAQRIVAKTNEGLNVLQKEVELTADMAGQLTDLAHTTKAMTGVKELSNNVIDILERAKSGTKLNAEDSEVLQKFVDESRQFVKEVERKPTINPPDEIKEKHIKDSVVKFLDKQEETAKERLRARGHRISSTPLDIWADYAIIGAAKMARGTIKFSDWSAEMVKDLGEEIKPMLANIYNKSSEALGQSAKKVTKSNVSNAERIVNNLIKNNKISGEDAERMKVLAEKVSNLSGDAKNVASQDLQFILRQLEKPTVLKKVSSAQTIAQLLNPKTQVRNALGNELFYRLERLNKYVTAPLDWGRVQLFGGQRSVTFRTNNQGEYWKNWLGGLKAGWRGVNVEGLQTQFDLGPAAFNSKWNPLTYMEKALGASLKSFDTAAYKRAVNDTIGEMATLRAINEGLTGEAKKAAIQNYIRNVDDHVLKISDDYGKYMTFQDNNLLSKGLVGLKRGLNFGKDFGIGDLVLKYPKTPGALLMRALEYSPAGFLRSASIAAKPFFKREPNTAEAMQALSRAIVGTAGLSGLGFFLADVGILTGAASKDKDVRELQRSAGQGQYQVNLSALRRWVLSGFYPKEAKLQEYDYLYTYDWAQPIAMAVSVGANVNQNLSEGKGAYSGLGGTIYSSIEGGINSLVETSVLSGVKRAFTNYPGQSVTDKITDIVSSAPASFVPTAVNQAKQLMENVQRETYDPDKIQQAFNQLKVKVPVVAGQLPQRYDTLGEKKVTYQNNSLFNVLLNPGFTSRYKLTPEAKMIVELIDKTGDTSIAPRVPGKSVTVYNDNGEPSKQKLTTEQFTELQRLTGEETVRLLKLIPSDFTNDQKLRAIADMLTDAGKKAKYDLKTMMGVK